MKSGSASPGYFAAFGLRCRNDGSYPVEQVKAMIGPALKNNPSAEFFGYRQRHKTTTQLKTPINR